MNKIFMFSAFALIIFTLDSEANENRLKNNFSTVTGSMLPDCGKKSLPAPVITLVSPLATTFAAGTDVVFTVTATDSTGITKVEMYVDHNVFNTWTSEPYTLLAPNAVPGNYVIEFIAYNASGQTSTTGEIRITVEAALTSTDWNTAGNLNLSVLSFLGTNDNMPLIFKTNNIENLRLQANGNLCLGTSNPLYKLDVNGTARFSNIITNGKIAIGTGIDSIINNYSLAVNGNAIFNKVKVKLYGNWSDYVFDQSYNLI